MITKDITVIVKLAFYLKDLVGFDILELKLKNESTIEDLMNVLKEKWPIIRRIDVEGEGPIIIILNNKPVGRGTKLNDGDEIKLIPPAIGG